MTWIYRKNTQLVKVAQVLLTLHVSSSWKHLILTWRTSDRHLWTGLCISYRVLFTSLSDAEANDMLFDDPGWERVRRSALLINELNSARKKKTSSLAPGEFCQIWTQWCSKVYDVCRGDGRVSRTRGYEEVTPHKPCLFFEHTHT